MKKTSWLIFSLALLLLPASALAFTVKTDNSVYVRSEEVVDGNLYAAGSNITVDGRIDGDLICAGQSVTVNGEVDGDILCAAENIKINGYVSGNIRVAGQRIDLNGQTDRQLMAFGSNIELGSEAKVGRDAFVAGETILSRGEIGRDLYGAAAQMAISGKIGKNIRLQIGTKDGLNIEKDAEITGDLVYSAETEAIIAPEAKVNGQKIHHLPELKTKQPDYGANLWSIVFSIFMAALIGLVLVSLWPKNANELANVIREKPAETFGWGLFLLIGGPLIVLLSILTMIGLKLGLLIFCLWLAALLAAKVFTAICVGRYLLAKRKKEGEKSPSLMAEMILGVLVSWLVFSLPYIGFPAAVTAAAWGLGGLALYLKKANQRLNA